MKTKQEESKSRRKWSADEKINIIRWQFNRSKLVEASEEFRVHPNQISSWWKTVLEAGREALSLFCLPNPKNLNLEFKHFSVV